MPKKSRIQQLEEAAGISSPEPEMPYKKGEYLKGGEKAQEWTGPRPWRKGASTSGSPPMTKAELKRGYRKVG